MQLRMIHLISLRVGPLIALTFCLAQSGLGAETAICTFGGVGTLEGAISLARDAREPENRADLTKPAEHSGLLALLVTAACPATAERVLGKDESGAETWMESLKNDLESSLPPNSVQATLRSLAGRTNCASLTPHLCRLQERLRELSSAKLLGDVESGPCELIGDSLMASIAGDLIAADGANVIDRTHDLATVLSFCPDQFYAFMHSHRQDLRVWLQQADRFLFWGDTPYKVILGKYRSDLIEDVSRSLHQSSFAAEKKEILAHFRHAEVTITQ